MDFVSALKFASLKMPRGVVLHGSVICQASLGFGCSVFMTSFYVFDCEYTTQYACVCLCLSVWCLKVKKAPMLSSAVAGKPTLGRISKVSSTVTPKVCVFACVCVCVCVFLCLL